MSRPKILIVDDDLSIVSVMSLVLSRSGFSVVSADELEEALSILDSEVPDAVVCDYQLRDDTGLRVLDHLRSLKGGEQTPFVLITAMWVDESQFDFGDSPATLVRKPCSPTHLTDVIADLLGGTDSYGAAA